MTILAHEWGHHIQNLAGSPQISKQAELQADCYGGMYLGFLADQGVLSETDIRNSLRTTYSVGDQPDEQGAWTDPDVHGAPNERRQAEGIGFSTGDGDYCVAFGDWQDQPAAPLFEDKSLRVEPFADPTPQDDGSLLLELPDAEVDVSELDLAPATRAGPELVERDPGTVPGCGRMGHRRAAGRLAGGSWRGHRKRRHDHVLRHDERRNRRGRGGGAPGRPGRHGTAVRGHWW